MLGRNVSTLTNGCFVLIACHNRWWRRANHQLHFFSGIITFLCSLATREDHHLPFFSSKILSFPFFPLPQQMVAGCKPAMLTGATESWRASERWSSAESFVEHYGDIPFKLTEVFAVHGLGKPRQVRLPLRKYAFSSAVEEIPSLSAGI